MKMIRLLLALTVLCGVIYPMVITVIAKVLFADKAQGSLVVKEGKVIGSKLLAQKFTGDNYFHPRPSAADYATVASGASQVSPTHKAGTEARELLRAKLPKAGVDAWTASGSGLDPHISPQNALSQIERVSAARGMSVEDLNTLVNKHIEGPTFGIWGQDRVNVLELNLALMSEGKNGNTGSTFSKP